VTVKGSFVARKQVIINAPVDAVWQALTDPRKVSVYMHGTTMETDWTVGGAITWTGEWKGTSYVDKGTVLAFEPKRLITTTHWSSMGGTEDVPENYRTVTYQLSMRDGAVVLSVTQDNNQSQEDADRMADNNWGPVLDGIKAVAES
jgi:uncharacterized protein YndB with AHSA1/START domain